MTQNVNRRYMETHPWITFEVNLSRASAELWILLGEARSKIEHLEGVPLRPETAKALHVLYLAKGAWATTAIEGNTLTEDQVRARVEGKLKLPPSQEYLGREIDNIVRAVNQISSSLLSDGPEPITPELICEFNRMILEDSELEPHVVPGKLRDYSVAAGPYVGAPGEDLEYLLQRFCDWLESDFEPPEGDTPDMQMIYVLIKAILAHLYFEWIHPFGDGNGRTGRLIELQILVASGVPFPAAHLLSNHYNLTRSEYYRQLHVASQSGGEILPFLRYAAQGLVDGLRDQISQVQAAQMEVAWENFVHQRLDHGPHSSTTPRQRTLVLELSKENMPVKKAFLTDLSDRVTEAYSGKTPKTLSRDLNALESMELVRRTGEGYVANKELMRAFLADKVVDDPTVSMT